MQLQMPSPASTGSRVRRSQFAVVLILVPLNSTFERKSLIVPFGPEVLKLGRQTTQRSIASTSNGFFDSRVLSRQHAEIWAERDSCKIWIKDCKSSNGTYINRQRLSGENAESDPFELHRGDILDLGIDISSDDNSALVYKKISARVEKVSMIPLHTTDGTSSASAAAATGVSGSELPSPLAPVSTYTNGTSLKAAGTAPATPLLTPTDRRTPSLSTLRPSDELQSAIFGSPLDSLALKNVATSVGSSAIKDDVRMQADFELAAKKLVAQIRAVKVDTARIQSVHDMLSEMQHLANQDPPNLAALRAEVDRLRAENEELTALVTDLRRKGNPEAKPRRVARTSSPLYTPQVNNVVVLVLTTLITTIAGLSVMFFFNPPHPESRLTRLTL